MRNIVKSILASLFLLVPSFANAQNKNSFEFRDKNNNIIAIINSSQTFVAQSVNTSSASVVSSVQTSTVSSSGGLALNAATAISMSPNGSDTFDVLPSTVVLFNGENSFNGNMSQMYTDNEGFLYYVAGSTTGPTASSNYPLFALTPYGSTVGNPGFSQFHMLGEQLPLASHPDRFSMDFILNNSQGNIVKNANVQWFRVYTNTTTPSAYSFWTRDLTYGTGIPLIINPEGLYINDPGATLNDPTYASSVTITGDALDIGSNLYDNNTVMVVSQAGADNVGINTPTPTGVFDVEAGPNLGAAGVILNAGNVGIGNTNPQNNLDVAASGSELLRVNPSTVTMFSNNQFTVDPAAQALVLTNSHANSHGNSVSEFVVQSTATPTSNKGISALFLQRSSTSNAVGFDGLGILAEAPVSTVQWEFFETGAPNMNANGLTDWMEFNPDTDEAAPFMLEVSSISVQIGDQNIGLAGAQGDFQVNYLPWTPTPAFLVYNAANAGKDFMDVQDPNTGDLPFHIDPSEAVSIGTSTAQGQPPFRESNGNTCINCTNPAYVLDVGGTSYSSPTRMNQVVDYGLQSQSQLQSLACSTYPGNPCTAYDSSSDDIVTSTGSADGQWRNSRTGSGP